jgi:hypothetical protein
MTLQKRLIEIAWPQYDCEDCIGMKDYGCQCSVYGAVAPGIGPEPWRKGLRRILLWAGIAHK